MLYLEKPLAIIVREGKTNNLVVNVAYSLVKSTCSLVVKALDCYPVNLGSNRIIRGVRKDIPPKLLYVHLEKYYFAREHVPGSARR